MKLAAALIAFLCCLGITVVPTIVGAPRYSLFASGFLSRRGFGQAIPLCSRMSKSVLVIASSSNEVFIIPRAILGRSRDQIRRRKQPTYP